jgi:hypothetical protein
MAHFIPGAKTATRENTVDDLMLRNKLNVGGNIRLEQPWAGSV